jgi:hypothetical protein
VFGQQVRSFLRAVDAGVNHATRAKSLGGKLADF